MRSARASDASAWNAMTQFSAASSSPSAARTAWKSSLSLVSETSGAYSTVFLVRERFGAGCGASSSLRSDRDESESNVVVCRPRLVGNGGVSTSSSSVSLGSPVSIAYVPAKARCAAIAALRRGRAMVGRSGCVCDATRRVCGGSADPPLWLLTLLGHASSGARCVGASPTRRAPWWCDPEVCGTSKAWVRKSHFAAEGHWPERQDADPASWLAYVGDTYTGLPILAEIYPRKSNLLGLNYNQGQKICLRLRDSADPTVFLSREEILRTYVDLAYGQHVA